MVGENALVALARNVDSAISVPVGDFISFDNTLHTNGIILHTARLYLQCVKRWKKRRWMDDTKDFQIICEHYSTPAGGWVPGHSNFASNPTVELQLAIVQYSSYSTHTLTLTACIIYCGYYSTVSSGTRNSFLKLATCSWLTILDPYTYCESVVPSEA